MQPAERRMLRASDPETALSFYLEAERGRRGGAALVLGTLDGRVIGGAGEHDYARVAAAAALKLHGLALGELLGDLAEQRFFVNVLQLGGRELVLTGVGGSDPLSRASDLSRIVGDRLDLS